jgi:hypothetical protein
VGNAHHKVIEIEIDEGKLIKVNTLSILRAIMSFLEEFEENFEQLKVILKDKWLDYYKINRLWITEMLENTKGWLETFDGGHRPPGLFILGTISGLEPSLKDLLLPFCKLNSLDESLIEVLGLDFDPDIELKKRTEEAAKTQEAEIVPLLTDPDTEYLNKIREEIK